MIYVSGDNFIATESTGFFCSDTGLHVHSGALCPTGAYAYVDAYDASATYSYIWTDSTTGIVIRDVEAVFVILPLPQQLLSVDEIRAPPP